MILLSVANLPNDTNENELEKLFSRYGKTGSIKLALGGPHHRYPGSGLIEIKGNDAQSVISALDGRLFRGMALRITEVCNTEKASTVSSRASTKQSKSSDDAYSSHLFQPFFVSSIEKVTEPDLLRQGRNWYRYTLQSGSSRITGLHRGTKAEVAEYAENIVCAFNLRNSSKGKRSITWVSHNKK